MDVAILAILACAAMAAFYGLPRVRRRSQRWSPRNVGYGRTESAHRQGFIDAADQLRIVMQSDFTAVPIMSRSEYKVFAIIEEHLRARHAHCRVMAQVSMGEVLRSPENAAFRCVNSKRMDMLIIGPTGLGIAALEYQGSGHHQGDAPARDAVKREALRRAGIEFIEIYERHTSDEIRSIVDGAITRQNRASSSAPKPLRAAAE